MCRWLNIPRSSYYYKAAELVSEAELEERVKHIFLESKSRYGTRKIKKCLEREGINLSRRRIRRIMKRLDRVKFLCSGLGVFSKVDKLILFPSYLLKAFKL